MLTFNCHVRCSLKCDPFSLIRCSSFMVFIYFTHTSSFRKFFRLIFLKYGVCLNYIFHVRLLKAVTSVFLSTTCWIFDLGSVELTDLTVSVFQRISTSNRISPSSCEAVCGLCRITQEQQLILLCLSQPADISRL